MRATAIMILIFLLSCKKKSESISEPIQMTEERLPLIVDSIIKARELPSSIGKRALENIGKLMVSDSIKTVQLAVAKAEIASLNKKLNGYAKTSIKQDSAVQSLSSTSLMPSLIDFRIDTIKRILYIRKS